MYSAIAIFSPGSITHYQRLARRSFKRTLVFQSGNSVSTIGYGDIVPVGGEVRMLAALEGITGVVYIAIAVGSGESIQTAGRLRLNVPHLHSNEVHR